MHRGLVAQEFDILRGGDNPPRCAHGGCGRPSAAGAAAAPPELDVLLEQRLTEAIATVIHEQTRSIVPRLREEVESVVRQSVYEAVADELAASQK